MLLKLLHKFCVHIKAMFSVVNIKRLVGNIISDKDIGSDRSDNCLCFPAKHELQRSTDCLESLKIIVVLK